MTIDYIGDLLQDGFSVEQIALAFIGAMADQALEDFNAPLVSYTYTDRLHLDSPVCLTMQAAVGSDPRGLVRSNVLWCLGQIPVSLFNSPRIWGINFVVKFRGQKLYVGRLDNRHRPSIALETNNNNQTLNTSSEARLTSRSLQLNFENNDFELRFTLIGATLPKTGIFESILGALLSLAPSVYHEALTSLHIANPSLPVWIYMVRIDVPELPNPLRVYQGIAILQAMTQYYVAKHIYQEMVFHVLVGGNPLAGGCVVKAEEARAWCAGMN